MSPTPAPRKTDAQAAQWAVGSHDGNPDDADLYIYSMRGDVIGCAESESLAAQIVREHNTHADLLAALTDAVRYLEAELSNTLPLIGAKVIVECARAAIQKAGAL